MQGPVPGAADLPPGHGPAARAPGATLPGNWNYQTALAITCGTLYSSVFSLAKL
jgi:hypothetical protein